MIHVKKQEMLTLLLGLADEQSESKLVIQRYIFGTEISPDYQALEKQKQFKRCGEALQNKR